MALSIDGQGSGIGSIGAQTGSVTTGSITSANAGDIAVVFSFNGTLSSSTSYGNVTSISDTTGLGLTWHQRAQVQMIGADGYISMESWWAYLPSAISAKTFTANLSTSQSVDHIDNAVICACCVTGFTGTAYQTAPWDTATAVGWSNSNNTATASVPSVAGVTPSSTSGLLLAFGGNYPTAAGNTGSVQSFGTWTNVNTASETGGVNFAYGVLDDQAYATSQSGTVTWLNSVTEWIGYVDALTIPAGGGSATDDYAPRSGAPMVTTLFRERLSGLLEPVRELWRPKLFPGWAM